MQVCKISIYLTLFSFVLSSNLIAQDPTRFKDEIDQFDLQDDEVVGQNLYVFTGSSSVRFWASLSEDFSAQNVINRGFGGSTMGDLLYYLDRLVIQYRPDRVFIYEGDNDIAIGKDSDTIMREAKEIVSKIRSELPETEVFFISPKPSVARWNLKDRYIQFNYKMGLWTMLEPKVHFIDVWTPMCDEDGEVFTDIFIGDNLHMNAKGYEIWREIIAPYVNN